jgi:hypothetical protein
MMAGILTATRGKITKKGSMMGFLTLEDLTGQIEGLVFPKVYERYVNMLAVDQLVMLEGKLSLREEEEPKLLVDAVRPLNEDTVAQGVKPRVQKEYTRPYKAKSSVGNSPVPARQAQAAEARKEPPAGGDGSGAAGEAGKAVPGNADAGSKPAARKPGKAAAGGKTDAQLAKEAPQRLYLLLPSRGHMDTVKRLCAAYPGDVPVYVKLQDEGIALLLSRDSWCHAGGDMLAACRELYGEGGVVVR